MNIVDIVKFSKDIEKQISVKKLRIESKYYPKAAAYAGMIVTRGEIIMKETLRMQKYMEDIEDGLKRLQSYGVVLPIEEKKNETSTQKEII